MDNFTYFDFLLREHQNSYFVVELKTDEILYLNDAMKTVLFGRESVIGKRFYDVINNRDLEFPFKYGEGLDFNSLTETTIYDTRLKQHFSLTHSLLTHKDTKYHLCRYIPVDDVETRKITFEEAMTRSISILQKEEHEIVPAFLALLGEFYQSEKVYLYSLEYDTTDPTVATEVYCVNCWVAGKNISVSQKLSDKIDINLLLKWIEKRNDVGIIEADVEYLPADYENTTEYQILDTFALKNLVLNNIEDENGKLIAASGLGNRKISGVDYRLLQTVTQFLKQHVTHDTDVIAITDLQQKDVLTGFLNRSCYSQKVDELQENPPSNLGVVFVNVNGLKKINSEFGYAKGDDYIKKSAELLNDSFDETFYRIAGDEFIAFFENIEKDTFEEKIANIHDKMKTSGNTLFALGHTWESGRVDVIKMIQDADTLMYINKQEYYHTSNRNYADISDSTLGDLLSYLDNDEFIIYLQPQVKLKDSSLYGAEALIRRFDKTNNKMVFPDQFIPLYEKKSVIRHVDIFVVEKVCQLLSSWKSEGIQIPISVNLSRVTLLEYGIVDTIADICDSYNIPHELLVIEVTERVGLIENNVASSLINDFIRLGFKISLDDFGCAYSNIVTLAQISVDEVKIDKSLVDFIVENQKNRVLVKNILLMCNELEGTSTLAEGIETKEQAELLKDCNCHLGQGYYFSRPIPTEEFFDKYIKISS